ncbi:MAG: Nif3-like dinuclear metal center hexameric protein [Verrucomicrobiales bacterium]
MVSLQSVCGWLDEFLGAAGQTEYPRAYNGLQIQNAGEVRKVAAAVDASLGTLKMAVEEGADLLLVHHGLFWSPIVPVVGVNYEKLKCALDHNLAVYSSHLPLDRHPTHGNNALLAQALGLEVEDRLLPYDGEEVGLLLRGPVEREELRRRLEKVVAPQAVTSILVGQSECRRIGLCTGGAGGELALAAKAGIDTFITGEGPHHTFALAEELGVNVFYAGHYATEVFGVRALAEEVERVFGLPQVFLDRPSGL